MMYADEHAPNTADPARIGYAIVPLLDYFEGETLMYVRGASCRGYVDWRTAQVRGNHADAKTEAKRTRTVSEATARKELGVLSAAIGYWHREHGPLDAVPVVTLPAKPEPKPDVLDRSEMARLLGGALGFYQLEWSDIATRQVHRKLKRDHAAINRHTARFIVIGRYTANRPGATLKLCWMPNTVGGWPDFKREVLLRKGAQVKATKKRQPSVRMGRPFMAHLLRWKRIDDQLRDELARQTDETVTSYLSIVNWGGEPIKDIGKSFVTALDYGGLPLHSTPHILRHSRVTWWVEEGRSLEDVADAAGMTVQMVEEVYWHRSPHFQKWVAEGR